MSTNATPQSPGIVLKKFLKASRPPAEAPTPTTGNVSVAAALRRILRVLGTEERVPCRARADVAVRRFVLRSPISDFINYSPQAADAKALVTRCARRA